MGIEDRDYYLDKHNPRWRDRAAPRPNTFTCFGCAGLGQVHRGHDGHKIRCPICFGSGRLKYANPTCSICPNFVSNSWVDVEHHIMERHSDIYMWAKIQSDLLNFDSIKPAPQSSVKTPEPKALLSTPHPFQPKKRTVFCGACGLHRENSIHAFPIPPRNTAATPKATGYQHEFQAKLTNPELCHKCGMPKKSAFHASGRFPIHPFNPRSVNSRSFIHNNTPRPDCLDCGMAEGHRNHIPKQEESASDDTEDDRQQTNRHLGLADRIIKGCLIAGGVLALLGIAFSALILFKVSSSYYYFW